MAHVLNSWAECARLEFDLQSEFEFHQSFLVMWKDHASISVPTLIAGALSEDRKLLSMGYVAWPRWADVFVSDKDRARKAMTLVATFFFDSISKEGLVHGDISPFNVLVNREGPLCVCMIDYGLCRRMSADEIGQLVKYSKEKSKSASMLSSVWSESGQVFGSRLWSSLQGCLMDDPFAKIDGVFVRSLLGMTRMACDVEYVNELGFHIIQRS
jgi:serine/threonine protein kinase